METRPSDAYLRAFTRLGDLVVDGRLDAALVEARRMRLDFPDQAAAVAHTEACLLALSRLDNDRHEPNTVAACVSR
ncbi:MAG TPA: hypothetical protein VFJ09_09755 [Nocardioidaceae bacterium]|nr:hypothetical protein [Nocardioidaceae bacterium]